MAILKLLFGDFTLAIVALGSAVLGIVAGSLGTFAVLRKQSLLGDSISHAALPGIVLAFMLTGSKSSLVLLLGAAFAGWIGTYFILSIIRNTKIDADGAQGVVLSVFFGLGLLLLTFVQKKPDASQAGLDKFLFGQAAALLPQDVMIMALFGGLALLLLVLFWKEIKLMTFDPVYGESIGFSHKKVDFLITALIVIAIVIGLQTVGVILMSAMIVAPAAASRQWTNRLGRMVLLSGIFGAASGVAGSVMSSIISKLPTGPTIVLCLTTFVVLSLFFAPDRGIAAKMIKSFKNRHHFSLQKLLLEIYQLEEQHQDREPSHDLKTIQLMSNQKGSIRVGINNLITRDFVETVSQGRWKLTGAGKQKAKAILGGETDEI